MANWLTGALFSLLNESGQSISEAALSPQYLADLLKLVHRGIINQNTGKAVLAEMFSTGKSARSIVSERGLQQISDTDLIAGLVSQVLGSNPEQVQEYLDGKEGLLNWLFGQVMRLAQGQANPQVVREELKQQLSALKSKT